jgi:hypothetical protein
MGGCVVNRVRDEVAACLERGMSLSDVDAELIEAAPALSEDERAALWLFAWSYLPSASCERTRWTRSVAG